MVQQVRPHHGETLLDGDAQSVRYGGMLRDRSRQPGTIDSQEVANSQNFINRIGIVWRIKIIRESGELSVINW